MQDDASSLGFTFDAVPGPDGSSWARISITNGPTAFIIALPTDLVDQMIKGIVQQWAQLKTELHRQNSPITLATPNDVARMGNGASRR